MCSLAFQDQHVKTFASFPVFHVGFGVLGKITLCIKISTITFAHFDL